MAAIEGHVVANVGQAVERQVANTAGVYYSTSCKWLSNIFIVYEAVEAEQLVGVAGHRVANVEAEAVQSNASSISNVIPRSAHLVAADEWACCVFTHTFTLIYIRARVCGLAGDVWIIQLPSH